MSPKVGDVTTTVADDGLSITNHTQDNHWFHSGRIIRQVHLHNGTWYVTTTGVGNNRPFRDVPNEKGGPFIFELVDQQMKKYIKDQLAR